MGSFSWLYADNGFGSANIRYGKPFKLMLPEEARKETGFVSLADDYSDYGILSAMGKTFDLYELLAVWNKDVPYKDGKVSDYLKSISDRWMKEEDENTDYNREIGISLFFDMEEGKITLPYPLKLVRENYRGLYEDLKYFSYSDPFQGSDVFTWSMAEEEMKSGFSSYGEYPKDFMEYMLENRKTKPYTSQILLCIDYKGSDREDCIKILDGLELDYNEEDFEYDEELDEIILTGWLTYDVWLEEGAYSEEELKSVLYEKGESAFYDLIGSNSDWKFGNLHISEYDIDINEHMIKKEFAKENIER